MYRTKTAYFVLFLAFFGILGTAGCTAVPVPPPNDLKSLSPDQSLVYGRLLLKTGTEEFTPKKTAIHWDRFESTDRIPQSYQWVTSRMTQSITNENGLFAFVADPGSYNVTELTAYKDWSSWAMLEFNRLHAWAPIFESKKGQAVYIGTFVIGDPGDVEGTGISTGAVDIRDDFDTTTKLLKEAHPGFSGKTIKGLARLVPIPET